jgi:two-component system, NtrC family, nitrogen regulation response regulator NtrX
MPSHLPRVLIVDDEENIGLSLKLILEREGYKATHLKSVQEFMAAGHRPDAALVDVRLPDGSGIEVLKKIRESAPEVPVIMISGQATIADAVEATRSGAFDFLEKPLGRDKVLLTLRHALEQSRLRVENDRLRERVGEPRIIGSSPAWKDTLEQATLAARSDARVLLLGESGTGKELLAEHIHRSSPFAARAFVKVNCAAIPTELLESELFGHEKGAFTGAASSRRGKFELADGGSIFLDEVGDLPLAAHSRFGARDLGHQSRPDANGRAAKIPRRSLLPPLRDADSRAAVAPARRRYSGDGHILSRRILPAEQLSPEDDSGGGARVARRVSMAGQCA